MPTFEKNGRGKIVNTASKGGIIAMTKSLAIEFAPKKINVNCVCPRAIKTGMTREIEENETLLRQTLMGIPAGRMGDPIDIANDFLKVFFVEYTVSFRNMCYRF